MKERKYLHTLIAVCFMCAVIFLPAKAKADSSQINVAADKNNAAVTVTVSDAQISGGEASVVCYNPSWNGSKDWPEASKYMVYMGQKKSGVSSFSFKLNSQPVSGNYTLVIGAAGVKNEVKFSFDSQANPGNPVVTPDNPKDTGKTQSTLKAPKIKTKVKGNKVTVSWKKIKGAKGYKVYVSNKKKGKYKVKATIKKAKKTKCTIKLKKGKKYFIKVCAYKKVQKKTVCGKYSNIKKVNIKK